MADEDRPLPSSTVRVVDRNGAWTVYAGDPSDPANRIYSGLDPARAVAHATTHAILTGGGAGTVHIEQPDGTLRRHYPH